MRKPWYLLTLVPLVLAIISAGLQLRETPAPRLYESPASVEQLLEREIPRWMARDHVPGLCVGSVSSGEPWLRCHGATSAHGAPAVDGRSRFAVASVSKTFTALAVLTLAEQGAFGLDDRVEPHLRSWRFPKGAFDGSRVTIRQLLTHTAGVGVPSYGGAGAPAVGETTRAVLDGRGARYEPVALVAPPGAGFRYSGGGYMVLQQLVEDASRLPFERFVVERVFRPLGMVDTSFSWGVPRANDTAGHDVGGHPLARRSYGAAMAPGAMVTTADDMMRFVAAFAESKLPASLGLQDGTWQEFVAPRRSGYGLALVAGTTNGHLLTGHAGTTMGYNAGFTVMPRERTGWFVLENGNGGPYLKAEIDRAFVAWKTGAVEPRYRLMQLVRAVVAFLGTLLPGLAILLLAFFAVSYARARVALVALDPFARPGVALRLLAIGVLAAFVAAWLVFFHTDAFYPGFTTAWLPYPFRGVTLGVVLFALRGALACVSVRRRAQPVQ